MTSRIPFHKLVFSRALQRTRAMVPGLGIVAFLGCATPPEPSAPEGESSSHAIDDRALSLSLTAALTTRDFTVQSGSFEFMDLSTCCQTTCSGNNPSSPYGAFFVPPAPGQIAANPNRREDGTSNSYRLRADEAIVYVGPTAPQAAYYGFTPYLLERSDATGARKSIFASIADTTNHLVLRTESGTPFEQRTAIIVAADAVTAGLARAALIESGVADGAINVITLDPAKGRFGIGANADTFGVLFRMALVVDDAKREAYMENPGGTVLRITPKSLRPSVPLPSPTKRPQATSPSESLLTTAVNRLSQAIIAAYPDYIARSVSVDDGVPDPNSCIQNLTFCGGDNPDTNYPGTAPRVLFASDDEFYIAFGVNHAATNKTVYSNVSVYALQKLVGLVGVASDEYADSARRYLPQDPSLPLLYAWKIARVCNGEPYCLEVPKGACPTGIENGALGTVNFRTYLEPSSKTAPLISTLVRDRLLSFKRR